MNQVRFAGGWLCQEVHMARIVSPTPYDSFTPVIRGFSSGKSALKESFLNFLLHNIVPCEILVQSWPNKLVLGYVLPPLAAGPVHAT